LCNSCIINAMYNIAYGIDSFSNVFCPVLFLFFCLLSNLSESLIQKQLESASQCTPSKGHSPYI
jgi:hypothetical protein